MPRRVEVCAEDACTAISGGKKTGSDSSILWMLDMPGFSVGLRVAGIGNETYLLDVLPAGR